MIKQGLRTLSKSIEDAFLHQPKRGLFLVYANLKAVTISEIYAGKDSLQLLVFW